MYTNRRPAASALKTVLPDPASARQQPVRSYPAGRAGSQRRGPDGVPRRWRRRNSAGGNSPAARPKASKLVLASRSVAVVCIASVLGLGLHLAYQLWWTNVQANAAADRARTRLEQQWGSSGPVAPGQSTPLPAGTFAPGEGFAILYAPKIGITYPIAEGTDKKKVLDHGLVGHYTGTAMPSDAAGNFAVAAHRTTHGEPFNQIGHLEPGDKVVVETVTVFYTYEVTGGIPETAPDDVTVLEPVPHGSPFTQPGRYLTMTTCTPEFSTRSRLVVFGKLVDERPRSQGKPPALGS